MNEELILKEFREKEVSQSWESLFDERFPIWWGAHGGLIGPEEVKEFIRSTLASALAEQARGIKEKCEEMKKIHRVSFPQSEHEKGLIAGLELGYNQAINDLADYLTNTYL